ncbi:VOC family protein [Streptomyces sp. NPDC020965]|uniref:VOC family protein n=1 Tax=Streptomyces sp. NPDC020965 TaxID=3365105 RepID=UPI00378E51CA
MAAFPEGTPCWVDAALPDVEAGRRFYGELFGWTFREGESGRTGRRAGGRTGGRIDAFSDGLLVAALAPKRDGRMPTVWGVYLAADDAAALTGAIGRAGGRVIVPPTAAGGVGTVAMVADPGGAVFGLWQAGERAGFGKRGMPGSFCWAELYTWDKSRADPFYATVFGFGATDPLLDRDPAEPPPDRDPAEQSGGAPAGGGPAEGGPPATGTPTAPQAPAVDASNAYFQGVPDIRWWSPRGTEPGDRTAVAGRRVLTDAFPAELPDHFLVYFCVKDCDATVATAVRLGGRVQAPPYDIPPGRIAVLTDNQGATFAVLAEPTAPGTGAGAEPDRGSMSESG